MKRNRFAAGLAAWMMVFAGTADVLPGTEILTLETETVLTAAAEESGGLEYTVQEDGTIAITGCDSSLTSVKIPAEIQGKQVTSIGSRAFFGCEELTSVTIPEGVISIGSYAFASCYKLEHVIIPSTVTDFGESAFHATKWLTVKRTETSLIIVNDILIDGYSCSGNVLVPNTVTKIGDGAFWDCSRLTGIVIPNSVTSIGRYAFANCSGLTRINLPNSITTIREQAFNGCKGLTEITIPDSVTSIGELAFYHCTALTNITILHPDCEIFDKIQTICTEYYYDTSTYQMLYPYHGTITGYEDSTAQAYAKKYNRTFISLGKVPLPLGDLNEDGTADATDASLILIAAAKAGASGSTGLSPEQETAADVNSDGQPDATDASIILMYAAACGTGYKNTLEVYIKRL